MFCQDSFKELKIKRLGKQQKFGGGSESGMIDKLMKLRQIEELQNGTKTIEIGKLILHNFTLHMPFMETVVNRVLVVKSLDLRECVAFPLNALFSFFLDRTRQIEQISMVQCMMSPYDTPAHGTKIVTLGAPTVLKIKKSMLPFDPVEFSD